MRIGVKNEDSDESAQEIAKPAPKLVKRSLNRKSSILSGRTIGAKREHLETANERAAARKRDKRKSALRLLVTMACFLILAGLAYVIYVSFTNQGERDISLSVPVSLVAKPTIEIVDEDASATGGKISSRMKEYVARVEECFREKGYQPQRATIPSSGVREVRFYLDGYEGFIKMIIDRDPAVSVEDADRMLHYLQEYNIDSFRYIDVRIDGKAYWK